MTIITGLTKERMLEIEAASVVNGEVVGDDLILTTHDSTEINAGNVRGPQSTGNTGARLATGAVLPANTYSNGVLTATANGALSIDGVLVNANDLVLVKDEVDGKKNGVYVVSVSGDSSTKYSLTRSPDVLLMPGLFMGVAEGVSNKGGSFVLTTDGPIIPGTTSLTFGIFVGAGAATNARNVFTKKQKVAIVPSTRSNLCTRPRPGKAPNMTNWAADHSAPAGIQTSTDIPDAFGGSNPVAKIVLTIGGASDLYGGYTTGVPDRIPCVAGDVISASAYVYQAAGNSANRTGMMVLQWRDSGGVIIAGQSINGPVVSYNRGAWQRITVTGTAPTGTASCLVMAEASSANALTGDIFYYDGLLYEKSSSILPYIDGSSPGGSWSGTAWASTSTITGEDAYFQGRDANDTTTIWQIDTAGKASFQGIDSSGVKITGVGDATADTDGLNRRTADARYGALSAPSSSLLKTIYAQSGRECNVYWDGFLRSGFPLSMYTFDVTCSKGEQDENRWTFTPSDSDAGTYAWSVDIYYNAVKIATYSSSLVVSTSAVGSGVTRKLVTIGDSTTIAGRWLAELQKLFVGDVMSCTQVGSLTVNANDSGGTNRTVKTDSVSGKTISYFYSDAASPFVHTGAFDFPNYLSANGISLSANDWVMIHLGINDVFSYYDDASCASQIAAMISNLNAMIANIKSAVTGIRIGLLVTIPPNNSQDAFGINYTSGVVRWRYKRNRDMWAEALKTNYDDATVSGVTAFPLHLNMDTRNNFPTAANTPVNARNLATTYSKPNNGVHPDLPGYWQMADSVYSFLKAAA